MKSLVIFITYWTFQIKFFTKIHRCIKIFFSKTNNCVYFSNTSGKTFFMELARPVPKIYRGLLSHRQLYTPCVDSKHYPFSKLLKHTHRYKYPANTLQFLPTLVNPKLWATTNRCEACRLRNSPPLLFRIYGEPGAVSWRLRNSIYREQMPEVGAV